MNLPPLKEFCSTHEELHAFELGLFFPIFLWPFLLAFTHKDGELHSLVKEEPHYIAFGTALRTLLALFLFRRKAPRQQGGV